VGIGYRTMDISLLYLHILMNKRGLAQVMNRHLIQVCPLWLIFPVLQFSLYSDSKNINVIIKLLIVLD